MSEKLSTGTLYICPTPIGNMADITLRVLEVLKSVDLIACEDTRQSAKLMQRYDIHTPLTSYHEHNRYTKGEKLLEMLLSGKDIALVSDAGMPGISDPGEDMVKLCIDNCITYTVLPGPSAAITALVMSGISSKGFVFEGFLPKIQGRRREILTELSNERKTVILYESPHQLQKTLCDIKECFPLRKMTILREITKKFEEKIFTDTKGACELFNESHVKGEFVIVIEGKSEEEIISDTAKSFEGVPIEDHLEKYIASGLDKKEAMKAVAKDLGISKREVYSKLLESEDNLKGGEDG